MGSASVSRSVLRPMVRDRSNPLSVPHGCRCMQRRCSIDWSFSNPTQPSELHFLRGGPFMSDSDRFERSAAVYLSIRGPQRRGCRSDRARAFGRWDCLPSLGRCAGERSGIDRDRGRTRAGRARAPGLGCSPDVPEIPGEQFHYILEGELIVDIDGRLVRVPKHDAVHVPARLPCRILRRRTRRCSMYSVQGRGHVRAPAARGEGGSDICIRADRERSGRDVTYAYAIGELDSCPGRSLERDGYAAQLHLEKSTSFRGGVERRAHSRRGDRQSAGDGHEAPHDPNEQFSFVLKARDATKSMDRRRRRRR